MAPVPGRRTLYGCHGCTMSLLFPAATVSTSVSPFSSAPQLHPAIAQYCRTVTSHTGAESRSTVLVVESRLTILCNV